MGFQRIINRVLYATGYYASGFLLGLIWRRRIVGVEHVPRSGPVIIAANHISFIDPPAVGSALPRVAHFIAKRELFDVPVFGWLIRQVNAISTSRGENDLRGFRQALGVLEQGGCLIIFPEGHRQPYGRFGRARRGIAVLARLSGAIIVPALIAGTDRLSKMSRVRMYFGTPMTFDHQRGDGYNNTIVPEKVMQAIQGLYNRHEAALEKGDHI